MKISVVKWSLVVALAVAGCETPKNRNASGDAIPAKSDAPSREQRAAEGKPATDVPQAGYARTSPLEQRSATKKRALNLSRADSALTDEAVAARFGLTLDVVRRLHTQRALSNEAIAIMPPAKLARAVWRLGHPKADHPDEAMKFRLQQQVDEAGKIPANALMNAVAEKKAIAVDPAAWKQLQKLEGPAADGNPLTAGIQPAAWTWKGPGNIGGRVRSILIHPTTPATMWAGSVGGGIWKTTNSGTTWAQVDDFMANLAVSTLAMDPTDSAILYAGTGEGFYNIDGLRGAGIFKSTNGGTNWTQLGSTTGSTFDYVNRLAIHPTNGQIILAATRSGIFRSTDGGTSWSQRISNDTTDVDFNPTDLTRCVASGYSGLVRYSTDGGVTWTAATGLTATGRVEVAYAASSPTTVYASQERNSGELYQSTDGGQTYTLKNTGTNYLGSQGWYDNALWVDPTNPAIVIVGGIDLYRSTNSGTMLAKISQWFSAPTSAHADHHCIVHQPGFNGTTNKTVFFGNDGGVYRATDVYTVANTTGWQELNNNLGVTQLYGAAGNATTGVIVAGTQDNGTLRFTTAGGTENWATMFGGDGGWCASDPTNSNYFYGEYVYANVHRSSNAGVSSDYISGQYWNGSAWVFKAAPYVITDAQNGTAQFISPFVLDPNAANRMLVGGASLWRTNDVKTANTTSVGPTWATIKASIGSNITAIVVAPGNSDIVWVGHVNGNVYKTTNGTAVTPTWTQVDLGTPNLPNRYCTRITIHPTNSSKVYVTFGGFNTGNVWRTDDAGVNWVNISAGLPAAPVRSLVIAPMETNYLYVGTEVGIFASANAGSNWSPTIEGPANVSVDELFWMGNTLVAATHGRGVFSVPVTVEGAPVITSATTANAAVGTAFNYQITATNRPTSFGATGLPTGLSVNGLGLISGTPTVSGSFSVGLSATNASGTGTATLALTVTPPAPANDNFASAQTLSGSSGTATGTNVNATKESGEPSHAGNTGGASIWFQWTAPTTGTATIDTLTSNFDTLQGTYTGSAVGSLTAVPNGSNDDDPAGGLLSKATFSVVSGTVYRIAVDGYSGATGSITLHYSVVASPTVTSLNLANVSPTNAGTVNWTLTFSSAVTGVTASNFSLSGAAATGASVGTPTTGNGGLTWNVPVSTGADGTLTLSLANATGQSPTVTTSLPFVGQSYVIDKTTLVPTLTGPSVNSITANPVSVSFSLPETALAGSVKLLFTGAASRTLTLAGSQETSGAHSFTFNPASPTGAPQVASIAGGATIPDGTYTVTLSYQDALGNAAATAVSTNVTIDTVTQTPVLTAPATNAITANPVSVNFSLPETALAGSVKLLFTGAASRTLTLASSQETSGAHSFTFNPASPTGSAQVASITGGATIPDGTYTITLSYQDALGNVAGTAASTNVRIDTTPPTLSLPANITVTATSPSGASVTYTASASDPGGSGVASSSFLPASGSAFPIGTTTVNATATDLAGNVANGSFTVTVNPNPGPTGGSFTITPSSGVHQGDSLSLSALGWSDPDTPLTYQFFNGTTSLNSPGVASTLNISAPAPGSYTLKVRVTDAAGSFVEVTQPLTVVPFTSVETWRQTYFGDYRNTGSGADNEDADLDGEPNRIEFAFGTNPTSGVSGPQSLQYTGTFAGGGAVTFAGQPTMMSEPTQTGVDLRALFVRRVDYAAAGLNFIVEFSADLNTWTASAATPTVLADNGTVQIVSVPAPAFLNVEKRKIVRVRVVGPP